MRYGLYLLNFRDKNADNIRGERGAPITQLPRDYTARDILLD